MALSQNTHLNVAIAKKIKFLRRSKKVTQEIFYFDTGIHLARIEQGKTNITVDTLNIICCYFEISLKEFFCDLDY